ncbi:MAG: hypothetical protein AAFS00_17225, partial [Bacteroidota bacterium]
YFHLHIMCCHLVRNKGFYQPRQLQTHWIAPTLALRFLQLLFTRKEVKISQQTSTLSWLELSWLIEAFISDQVTAHYVQMKIDAYGLTEEAGFTRIQDKIDQVFALPSP